MRNGDRIRWLIISVAVLWGIFVLRTFQIQVIDGSYYADRAEKQSQRRIIWKPIRGRITDRYGVPFADNVALEGRTSSQKRIFPQGQLAAQLLGQVGRDGQGLMGLEYLFDENLRGVDGWSHKTVDNKRNYLPGMERVGRPPTPGMDLVLTLERDMQEIVETALAEGVRKLEADGGAALVMDPYTGEILAMASYPTYDPNLVSTGRARSNRNDIVSLVFEPGSTFKLVTASAALEEKAVDPKRKFSGEGGHFVLSNGDVIRDTKDHGEMDMTEAMAFSSNIVFAKIAQEVGQEKFFRYVRSFGFGSPTQVEIPGEESGMLKPVHQWSGRTLMTMAFGHEIMVTPLQMVMAFNAVANGGVLLKPTVVHEWHNSMSDEVIFRNKPDTVRRVMSEETAAQVRQMLREVVQVGTARNIVSRYLDFAGKTGTAEKYNTTTGRYDRSSQISSFIGMVPASNPRYVCLVLVDEPRTATVGAFTAGPVFKEIMERIYFNPKVSPLHFNLAQAAVGTVCQDASFIGLSRTDAQKRAEASHCPLAFTGEGTHVVAQQIASEPGVRLSLTLGDYRRTEMPDVRGLSLRDALEVLGNTRNQVRVDGKGWVSEQFPEPSVPLARGDICRLVLKEKS